MKTNRVIVMLLAVGTLVLSSCVMPRVNERQIGYNNGQQPYQHNQATVEQQNALLNDVMRDSAQPGQATGSMFNPDPGNTGSGTINNMIGSNPTPVQPRVDAPVYDNSLNTQNNNRTITAPTPVTPRVSNSIPTARRTSDPTVVISPYDSSKKIKILNRRTNKPYPSGTVLRDTNYPNEIRKFRVP